MATLESMSEAALARKHRIAMRRNRQRSSSVSTSSSATISSFADNEEEIKTSAKNSKRSLSALQEDDVEEDTPIFVSSSTSNCEEVVAEEDDDVQQTPPKKQKPHITGIKKQSRYDPGVTLNKDELKAWRKEARRVRNRESAAASRKKNRESIESLQTKVDNMTAKYTAALQYILDLEGNYEPQHQQIATTPSPSTALRQDLEEIKKTMSSSSPGTFSVSRPCSPVREVMLMPVQTVSPPTSPIPQTQEEKVQQEKIQRRQPSSVQISNNQDKNTPNNHPLSDHDHHCDHHPTSTNSQSQHIIDTMISRPIAAKISPGAYENKNESNDDKNNDDHEKKDNGSTCVYDTVVSDDDTDGVKNNIFLKSTYSSRSLPNETDHSSYCGSSSSSSSTSDDDTTLESDQPLFLDDIPDTTANNDTMTTMIMKAHDPLIECAYNVKDINDEDEVDDTTMADFLMDTFVASSDNNDVAEMIGSSSEEMDALLLTEDDGMMFDFVPLLCIEN